MKRFYPEITCRFLYVVIGLLIGLVGGIYIAEDSHSILGANHAKADVAKHNYIRGCIEAFQAAMTEPHLEQAEECRVRGEEIRKSTFKFIDSNEQVQFIETPFTVPYQTPKAEPKNKKQKKKPARNNSRPEFA